MPSPTSSTPSTNVETTHKKYEPACKLVQAIEYVLSKKGLPRDTPIRIIDTTKLYHPNELRIDFYDSRYDEYMEHLTLHKTTIDNDSQTLRIETRYGQRFINWLGKQVEIVEQISLTLLTDLLPTVRQIAIDNILADLD